MLTNKCVIPYFRICAELSQEAFEREGIIQILEVEDSFSFYMDFIRDKTNQKQHLKRAKKSNKGVVKVSGWVNLPVVLFKDFPEKGLQD